jgi:hypothetical protein
MIAIPRLWAVLGFSIIGLLIVRLAKRWPGKIFSFAILGLALLIVGRVLIPEAMGTILWGSLPGVFVALVVLLAQETLRRLQFKRSRAFRSIVSGAGRSDRSTSISADRAAIAEAPTYVPLTRSSVP